MHDQETYAKVLQVAKRAQWRIEDVIGDGVRLDFTRPFLPETLARTNGLAFLNEDERLAVNHIRAHGYLCLFALVERFILPFVEEFAHAAATDAGDDEEARPVVLAQFADQEAKHIRLFEHVHREFERGFGTPCAVIGPADQIARGVLAHHPLGVALAILHIEWMTQRHYLDSVRGDATLAPQFKRLLHYHWMEESQHAKLDTLIVGELAQGLSDAEIERAVLDYMKIVTALDEGLAQQVSLDQEAFALATHRCLSAGEQARFAAEQQQALRWTFLGSGMTHQRFLAALERIHPQARAKIERTAPIFC